MHTQGAQLGHICAASIAVFEGSAFEAISLDTLAGEIGLTTGSLRRYFPDPAAVYVQSFREAARVEMAFARAGFDAETTGMRPGAMYNTLLAPRYSESAHLRFLLRGAYAPPDAVRAAVTTIFSAFLADITFEFRKNLSRMDERARAGHDPALLEMVYLDTLDGIYSRLVDGVRPAVAPVRRRSLRDELYMDV
jgi:AcrR family transcriptional regulator